MEGELSVVLGKGQTIKRNIAGLTDYWQAYFYTGLTYYWQAYFYTLYMQNLGLRE